MSDNAWSYTLSRSLPELFANHGIRHLTTGRIAHTPTARQDS